MSLFSFVTDLGGQTLINQNFTITSIPVFLSIALGWGLVIGAVIVFGCLVISGFQWATAGNEPSKAKSARDNITNCIFGFGVLASTYAIALVVQMFVGTDNFQVTPPGPVTPPTPTPPIATSTPTPGGPTTPPGTPTPASTSTPAAPTPTPDYVVLINDQPNQDCWSIPQCTNALSGGLNPEANDSRGWRYDSSTKLCSTKTIFPITSFSTNDLPPEALNDCGGKPNEWWYCRCTK